MDSVFINYRRDQTAGEARALHDELSERLGDGQVFMDVDDIELGRDFREVLSQRLAGAKVMLALIGRDWLEARDAAGARRIEQPGDFVRIEIATALQQGLQVVPVLLQGAQMPASEKLPEDLRELSFRNGFSLSHATWKSNVGDLVRRLGLVPVGATAAAPAPQAPARGKARLWIGAGIAAVAVGVGATVALSGDVDVEGVFRDLGAPRGEQQAAAARRLSELRGSKEAVTNAVGRLNPQSWFPMKSYKGRSELVSFLIEAEDSAYTPATKAQAKLAARDMLARVENQKITMQPESVDLLRKLVDRLER